MYLVNFFLFGGLMVGFAGETPTPSVTSDKVVERWSICIVCVFVSVVICISVGEKKTKRRRSSFLSTSSDLSPTSKCSSVTGALPPRLTERQQLALLLQMTAEKQGLSSVTSLQPLTIITRPDISPVTCLPPTSHQAVLWWCLLLVGSGAL